MSDHDRSTLADARVRSAAKSVAKALGYKVVGELWGCDEHIVGLKLDEINRNYVKPREMLELERHDVAKIIEAARKAELEPPSDPAKVVSLLPGVLRSLFAEELAELVERKLGLR